MASVGLSEIVVSRARKLETDIRALQVRADFLRSIMALQRTPYWPQYVELLDKLRKAVLEQMVPADCTDDDRRAYAAEARVYGHLSADAATAADALQGIERCIEERCSERDRLEPQVSVARNIIERKKGVGHAEG